MHPFISSPLQIAAAAVISMGLAQALHLPDPYWAPISAIVCSLDAFEGASTTARRRLVGTLLGVVLAGLQVCFTGSNLLSYGFAIALSVVASDPNQSAVWLTAAARFVDVALGISVALVVVKAWPQRRHQG